MKKNTHLLFLLFFGALLVCKKTTAQIIRNDTIFVNAKEAVTVVFPSTPTGGSLVGEGDLLYKIDDGPKNAFMIKALRPGVKDQRITITEGKRVHEFVLSYRENLSTLLMNKWVKKNSLKDYVKKKDDNAAKRLDAANQLYDQGKFEEALAEYKWLVWEVNKSKESFVSGRISETETKLSETTEYKYKEAMARGDKFTAETKYRDAVIAYDEALAAKPNEPIAKDKRRGANNLLFEGYKKKAEAALDSKNYIVAEFNYFEAKKVDSVLFMPNEKSYRNVVENAKKQREKNEKEKKYYTILADAKLLAAKAVTAQDYDIAIKEYEKASEVFPSRKFSEDKKQFLTKMKKSLSAKK